MSSVDNRIVKMQFENGQFESGAKATLTTLQRLKEALNFTGAGKNLDSALNNAGNANLSGLEKSVDSVNNKFSILSQAAAVALGNIATQAIATGASMVKAFAIEPITQGFQEYELKMNSIQTMMMSTGEPLERVNQKLDELNTYADKTIYSFSDMTQNIGKFTNAGVDLDRSVAAIQGVANVAALSGANANEASHAMYNFGQALSAGAVKLIDWKSIENANMATVEFKNELIKTAVSMGTLTKEGDKYISTTTDLNGHVSDAFNATTAFNDSLSSQWMTTEVLTETLNRYADETTEIGKKAFKAATQVKTFSQLIDTTKEAIGSGWAQTFEIIVGDFNEALELWTNVAGVLDNFVSKTSNARNDMLRTWKDLGGRTAAIEALSNVFGNLGQIMGAIGRAWEKAFPPLTGTKLYSITQSIKEFTERLKISESTVKAIETLFSSFFGILSIGAKAVGILIKPIALLAEGFLKLLGVLIRIGSPIGSLIDFLTNAVFSFDHLNQAGEILRSMFEKLISPIKALGSLFGPVFDSAGSGFDSFVSRVEKGFDKVYSKVKTFDLKDAIKPLSEIGVSIANMFSGIGTTAEEALTQLGSKISSQSWFQSVIQEIKTYRDNINKQLNDLANTFANKGIEISSKANGLMQSLTHLSFGDIGSVFESAKNTISEKINRLKDIIDQFAVWVKNLDSPSMNNFFDSIKEVFEETRAFIDEHARRIREIMNNFFDGLGELTTPKWDKIFGNFSSISSAFSSMGSSIQNGSIRVQNIASAIFKGLSVAIAASAMAVATVIAGIGKSILSSFDSIGVSFEGVTDIIGINITSALDKIKEYFSSFSKGVRYVFDEIIGLFKNRNFGLNLESSGFALIAMGIKKLLDNFSNIEKNSSKILKGVAETLDTVQDSLKAWQNNLKADTLLKIAAAIGVLAASMLVLSSIPAEGLQNATIAIGAAALTLSVAMRMMSKMSSDLGSLKLVSIGLQLMGLATGVLIMSQAMKQLSGLDNQSLGRGILGVTAMVTELVAVAMIMSGIETANITKGVMSLLIFSQAIKTMAKAAEALSSLNTGQILQGLASVAALELGLGLFITNTKLSDLKPGSGFALMEVATALLEMSASVAILGNFKMETLIKGLGSIAVLLVEIGAFTKMISGTSGLIGQAAGLTVMSVALLGFTASVAAMGSLPLPNLAKGLIGLGVAIGELVLALRLMEGVGLSGAASIFVVSSALAILTPVLITLGATWPVAASGIAVMAAALGVLGLSAVVLSPLAPTIMAISASMLALSSSVLIAGAGVTLIGIGLAGLAAGITALAAVAGPAIDAVISAFVKLGSGVLNAVINLAPLLEEAFIAVLNAIAGAIVDTADVIIDAFVSLGVSLCNAIIVLSDPLAQAFMELLTACLVAIADHAEEFTDAGIRLITGFINGITGQLDNVVSAIGSFIVGIINAVATAIRDYSEPIMAAVRNLISSIIEVSMEAFAAFLSLIPGVGDQLAQSLLGTKEKVREAIAPESMYEIGNEAGTGLANGFGSTMSAVTSQARELATQSKQEIEVNSDGTFDIGALRGQEYGNGIGSMIDFANQNGIDLTDSALTGILSNELEYGNTGTNYGDAFSTMLGNQSGNAQAQGTSVTNAAMSGIHSNDGAYPAAGTNDGSNFASGVGGQSGNAYSNGVSVAAAGASGASSQSGSFYSAGDNAGSGFCAGLSSWIGQAQSLGSQMANIAANATAAALQEHSPSRVMREKGSFAGEGFILGMRDTLRNIEKTGASLGETAIDSLEDIGDMDYRPTITPVIDMTEVQDGASRILSLLESSKVSFNGGIEGLRLQLQNGSNFNQLAESLNVDNKEVVDEIQGLREDIAKLAMAVTSMQVVLDSGVLVGATSAQMDSALQSRQTYAERGM